MLAPALRRLSLLATLGLAIWLIARFKADQQPAVATPWPQVPVDPAPVAPEAGETALAVDQTDQTALAVDQPDVTAPTGDQAETLAESPSARAKSVALRRPGQVISLNVPVAEELPLTAGEPDAGDGPAWVEPVDGACPPGYLVKAKLTSHLYHEPGMLAYKRTHPDRCYIDGAAAERDGFVKAKR
jgi:hypothetical protein